VVPTIRDDEVSKERTVDSEHLQCVDGELGARDYAEDVTSAQSELPVLLHNVECQSPQIYFLQIEKHAVLVVALADRILTT